VNTRSFIIGLVVGMLVMIAIGAQTSRPYVPPRDNAAYNFETGHLLTVADNGCYVLVDAEAAKARYVQLEEVNPPTRALKPLR